MVNVEKMEKTEKTRKGQSSIEFFILFSILLFSFIFLIAIVNFSNEILNRKFRMEKNREIAKELSMSINRIFISGNGSSTKLYLPSNYSFYYSAGAIHVVDAIGSVGSFVVYQKNITVLKNNSEISIRNLNGEIVVE